MTAFYFKDVPEFHLQGFVSTRSTLDNLSNLLTIAELVNKCSDCISQEYHDDFDLVIFSGNYRRAIVRKKDGYFSLAIPFQLIANANGILFNYDMIREPLSGRIISILRNALLTSKEKNFSHEDILQSLIDSFELDIYEADQYCDAFINLLAEDHGYFRFDHDPERENGQLHPLYHLDFFLKNASAVKIGTEQHVNLQFLLALIDNEQPKHYIKT